MGVVQEPARIRYYYSRGVSIPFIGYFPWGQTGFWPGQDTTTGHAAFEQQEPFGRAWSVVGIFARGNAGGHCNTIGQEASGKTGSNAAGELKVDFVGFAKGTYRIEFGATYYLQQNPKGTIQAGTPISFINKSGLLTTENIQPNVTTQIRPIVKGKVNRTVTMTIAKVGTVTVARVRPDIAGGVSSMVGEGIAIHDVR